MHGLHNMQCNVQTNSSAIGTSINNPNNSGIPFVVHIRGNVLSNVSYSGCAHPFPLGNAMGLKRMVINWQLMDASMHSDMPFELPIE